ncbi:MAG: HlyC/CorC family transporter [Rikenellaceae bacterium]|nr:HlyC/CorC family transporter [Rikenellaceae bacterium]
MTTSILIILVMLLLSAFFSGMEIAFTSKNRLRLEIDRKQSRLFDHVAEIFARHPGQYVTTILVGNNIALVVYQLCMSLLLRGLAELVGWSEFVEHGSVLAETIISTLIVIFCGEFIPKSIVKQNPNFYYRTFAPLIYLFYLLLYPLARLTTGISQGILWILGHKTQPDREVADFNRSDLVHLLDTNSPEPQHESENELKLFQNALYFTDLRVRDCMIPRVDVEAVDADNTTIQQLTDRFVETQYTRLFVWRKSIDNMVGYVNSKSLFQSPQKIDDVIMEVLCVPETMPLQDLLEQMTKHKTNVAVVIDEFGGTAGIISLEDILEQIFGEIEDEHDTPDLTEKQISENEWVLSCRLEVKYLNEKYDLGIEESKEYDTLAGYIIYQMEGIPSAGETVTLDRLHIKLLRTTRSRVELARIKRL